MPTDIPFFKTGSNLLKDKMEKLEREAAVTEKMRDEYAEQESEISRKKQAKEQMQRLETKFQINSQEIERRQSDIVALDRQAEQLRMKMEGMYTPTGGSHGSHRMTGAAQHAVPGAERRQESANHEQERQLQDLSRKMSELEKLKSHHAAEISRLNERNTIIEKEQRHIN